MLFLIIRRPPRSTRTDTLFPYTTLVRSPQPVARVERLCDLRWRDGIAASGEPVRHGEDDRAAMAIRVLYGGDAGGDGRSGAGNSAGRDGHCAGRRCPDAESRGDKIGRAHYELQSLLSKSDTVYGLK